MAITEFERIVNELATNMPKKNVKIFTRTKRDELFKFHLNWGMHIRNKYNLWHDTELLESMGVSHADDASTLIMEAVWDRLTQ